MTMEISVNSKITKIEQLDDYDNEYVYDIGIDDETPYFFANDILVHNSGYFSAYSFLKNNPDVDFEWTKENVVNLYNAVADQVNETFAPFLLEHFNVPEHKCVIKAGRELVASKGLFITKKRYAVLMYDKENNRLDTDGKPGKIKAMGLDLKRADTPTKVQKFLEETLMLVLTGKHEDEILEFIKKFRDEFRSWTSWEKGTPKKVNNLTKFRARQAANKDIQRHIELSKQLAMAVSTKEIIRIQKEMEKTKKVSMPGHVSASLNWNRLKELFNDTISMPITDGSKIIVCKLKPNIWNMKSVAYPIDELRLPDWFKKLPFDDDLMETTIVDKKLNNLIGVLKYDLDKTRHHEDDALFQIG